MKVFIGIVFLLVGYMLGSVNAAVIISKLLYKSDIRQHGSGNAGTTNMLRTYGKKAAVLTFLVDLLKGVFACFLAWIVITLSGKGDEWRVVCVVAAGFGRDFRP